MTASKRIGILTFHRCINYGSYWQARCLAEGLRARGHDAVLLDHHSRRINLAEWRCALRPIPEAPAHQNRSAYVEKPASSLQPLMGYLSPGPFRSMSLNKARPAILCWSAVMKFGIWSTPGMAARASFMAKALPPSA